MSWFEFSRELERTRAQVVPKIEEKIDCLCM